MTHVIHTRHTCPHSQHTKTNISSFTHAHIIIHTHTYHTHTQQQHAHKSQSPSSSSPALRDRPTFEGARKLLRLGNIVKDVMELRTVFPGGVTPGGDKWSNEYSLCDSAFVRTLGGSDRGTTLTESDGSLMICFCAKGEGCDTSSGGKYDGDDGRSRDFSGIDNLEDLCLDNRVRPLFSPSASNFEGTYSKDVLEGRWRDVGGVSRDDFVPALWTSRMEVDRWIESGEERIEEVDAEEGGRGEGDRLEDELRGGSWEGRKEPERERGPELDEYVCVCMIR